MMKAKQYGCKACVIVFVYMKVIVIAIHDHGRCDEQPLDLRQDQHAHMPVAGGLTGMD